MARVLANRIFNRISKVPVLNLNRDIHLRYRLEEKQTSVTQLIQNPLNDPNKFGTLSVRKFINKEYYNSDDEKEKIRVPRSRKLSTKEYADIIKGFIKKNQIKAAIDVLEVRMLKQDQVKPENYIYSLLIGACGRVGYTKEAFKLFNDMKKRGLKVHAGMYTGLFNACANSPWKEDGLSRAAKLRELITEKQHDLNDTNYHAMIKAFGRQGDILTAFSIADEMISKKIRISTETINFLLQACISNVDEGFRYALLVWRKMIDKKLLPNLYTFNLMLRSVRDCGIGHTDETIKVINEIINKTELLPAGETQCLPVGETKELVLKENRPNLLAKVPYLGDVIEIKDVKKPEDKLLLIGGVQGVLDQMNEYKLKPDIKTFTQILDCIPQTYTAEKHLLTLMKKYKLKPDVDFFNMLIKKRSQRFDHEGAKEVLEYIDNAGLKPNLITYGVLAIGCKNKEEANKLITIMEIGGYRLNSEILGAMLQQACHHNNFGYVMEIMELSHKEQIKPNKIFMERLLKFRQKCLKILQEKNTKEHLEEKGYFQSGFKMFNMRYQTWKTQVQVDETEDEHPWQQFRENTETDGSLYLDKSTRFKPRHQSQFRVKTSTKVRY